MIQYHPMIQLFNGSSPLAFLEPFLLFFSFHNSFLCCQAKSIDNCSKNEEQRHENRCLFLRINAVFAQGCIYIKVETESSNECGLHGGQQTLLNGLETLA